MKQISIKNLLFSIFLFALPVMAQPQQPQQSQGLRVLRLNNGMNVFIWEDHSKPDVFGEVVVKTGSVNDPSEYTGLAHYLEHVMFKGTTKIGTTDWAAEAPLYEQIIAKYDEMAEASDPEVKQRISDEINRLSVEASGYGVANEYANLIESIGGTGLNAATSFDQTFYYNSFPANQLSRWLFLASERFINPVFRAFQSELETVYEEYNMTKDNPSSAESEFMLDKLFAGQPYARPIIGLGDHLKNPRLSELIKFYDKWYVPSNMALILVGDVSANQALRLINSSFGRIAPKPLPQPEPIQPFEINGRIQYNFKAAQYPSIVLAYKGVPENDPDAIALELAMRLLSNPMQTGLLDALSVEGVVMAASAAPATFAREGRLIVQAIPRYDSNTRCYESNRKLEKRLLSEVAKLSSGEFSPWIFQSLKDGICRDFDLLMESSESKADFISDIFVNGKDITKALDYKSQIAAITPDDIKRVAEKYLSNGNYIVICNDEGRIAKQEKISKPKYDPIKSNPGVSSAYAQWFNSMAAANPIERYVDWSTVQEAKVNDYSRLYYTKSEDSDVFSLVVRYGAGSYVFKKLEYAASLIDNAGIMGAYKPQALKERLARLGVTLTLNATDEYMYVTMRGYDESLKDACQMLFQMVMMPQFEETQLDNLIGSILSSRYTRKRSLNTLSSALREYVLYDKNSDYVNEVTDTDVYDMTVSELTAMINQAAGYAADIFYTGLLPFDEVKDILSNNLPLVKGEKPQASPRIREMRKVTENTVFFLPNSDAQQAQIYFYIPVGTFTNDPSEVIRQEAFNRYFGGGFSGLVMQQIREYNSMAYTAYGAVTSREVPGAETFFTGYVATQNDKAIDAIKLYLSLIGDMPENESMINPLKGYLCQSLFTSTPDARSKGMAISEWKLQGYTDDPAHEKAAAINSLEFKDILDYYNENIKGRPIVIGIVGNPRDISTKDLAAFGKVVKVGDDDLFNTSDRLF